MKANRILGSIAGGVCLLFGLFQIAAPRFMYPELTETQLFINYWILFISGFLWSSVGYSLIKGAIK